MTAETVAANNAPARPGGAGPAGAAGGGGSGGSGGMGGGMGGMGHGAGGQGNQGKEKRRDPNLSADEDLYVEDRAYTEGVVGHRPRKPVSDKKTQ
ncbi:hypothetical protein [Mycolicibacterium mageritense]|uniref:hypothetical protein n=1 Tax=Mycolicibacterium mageritense TaxID=53462 RepID=UPI0022A8BD01|nr:hypothetical protein [Mycolicibacterium mageritense]